MAPPNPMDLENIKKTSIIIKDINTTITNTNNTTNNDN